MSEPAFTIADNSFQNTSSINENSSTLSNPDQFLLQDGYADRIVTALQQHRDSAMSGTEIVETTLEAPRTSTGINFDVGESIDLPDLTRVSWNMPQVSFHVLQEWEGYVTKIEKDDFTVRLLDLTAGSSHEEEEAIIPFSEISEDDLKRLRLGSVFRWVIGYERSASGTKRRVSEVVFRELPVVTKQDLAEAEERARKTAQLWAE